MAKATAFITGLTGQDGTYLTEQILARGDNVVGLVSPAEEPNNETGKSRYNNAECYVGDITDSVRLNQIIQEVQPDEVYHLAAMSHVGRSFREPVETCNVTALGTVRLLEAVRHHAPQARFCNASTAAIFASAEEPLNEESPRRPSSPYGAAKLLGHTMVETYRSGHGIFACNAILFNHESPRRGPTFVTRKITQGIARLVRHGGEPLKLGNVDARRDWGWAPDYTAAMQLMLQQPNPGDFVIATGETHSVREFATSAAAAAGMELEWKGTGLETVAWDRVRGREIITIDPQFYRPLDAVVPVGDPSRAHRVLGWKPTQSFDELVRRMVLADLSLIDKITH